MKKLHRHAVVLGGSLGFAVGGTAAFAWELAGVGHELVAVATGYALIATGALALSRRATHRDFGHRMLAYFMAMLLAVAVHLSAPALPVLAAPDAHAREVR